jgi:pimeloyl-ACP methyl ester carboxylesterase
MLVPHGIACLSVAYFHYEDLPAALCEIPVERVEAAARWLRARPDVRLTNGRVGVLGVSKGAEFALVAATTFPDLIGPVVAWAPSSVVWAGVDVWRQQPDALARSSWSFEGRPLRFVPYPAGVTPETTSRGIRVAPIYESGLLQHDLVDQAVIAVERLTGPVLLISGGQDGSWPATQMASAIVTRMRSHGLGDLVRHIDFPACGHDTVRFPGWDPTSTPFDLGPEATDAAHDVTIEETVGILAGT